MTDRRRALLAASAAVCIAVASLAACESSADDGARTSEPAPAEQLSATCTPDGVEVSGTALVTSPEGATFEVSSSAPGRTYLVFDGDGWSGPGDPVPRITETWTLPIPPGEITLSCMRHGATVGAATARVDLTDPGQYWYGSTLADAGCPGQTEPYWTWDGGSGDTPRAAVDDLLAEMSKPGRSFTAEPAEIGYVDATGQTWLISRDGKPYISALVYPSTMDAGLPDPAGGYSSYPGVLC